MALPVGFYGSLQWIGWLSLLDEVALNHWNTQFRHTFATMLLEDDVDIRYIQKILGHSSISVTQIYTYVTSAKKKEIMLEHNPRKHFVS